MAYPSSYWTRLCGRPSPTPNDRTKQRLPDCSRNTTWMGDYRPKPRQCPAASCPSLAPRATIKRRRRRNRYRRGVYKAQVLMTNSTQSLAAPIDNSVFGNKEDELEDYSSDELRFLQCTIQHIRQRPDGMIEIPLSFRTPKLMFTCNRSMALKRTISALQTMLKKHPTVFKSSLEKFAKTWTSITRDSHQCPQRCATSQVMPIGYRYSRSDRNKRQE